MPGGALFSRNGRFAKRRQDGAAQKVVSPFRNGANAASARVHVAIAHKLGQVLGQASSAR
jgi:hypothetical protein